jgi:vacuolar-type H+-ATPase subunit D/Vma8
MEPRKKEYDDLHKARHFSVRSAAATLKGKKKALIAKEEAEYQQAFEAEQQAKRKVDMVSSELATLSAKVCRRNRSVKLLY